MLLIDSSAWIDYLRSSGSAANLGVRQILRDRSQDVVVCEPVAMELLAGASSARALGQIEQLVNGLTSLPLEPATDFRNAAGLFRDARRSGRTVRNLTDCLIAAIALRTGATVVHKDVDFDVLGEIADLHTLSLRD
jgi:predicted nucleic acid-binding protein